MDLENLLHSLSRKGKKRIALESSSDVNVEPLKRSRKTTANKKRALQTIDLETPEVQIHVHTPAIPHVEELVPETDQATTSSSKAPQTLPIEAMGIGSEYCALFAASYWLFIAYDDKKGIFRHKKVPKTPQQNVFAERMDRTLIERVSSRAAAMAKTRSKVQGKQFTATKKKKKGQTSVSDVRKTKSLDAILGVEPIVFSDDDDGNCSGMGHVVADCRKKVERKQEWIAKDVSKRDKAVLQTDHEGFRPVTKGWKSKEKEEGIVATGTSNSFQVAVQG
uniref:Uncharacterized protein n=1 Tax=Cannabis sativa TaxID=3483 RepID=A0A803PB77_CANSA